MSAPLLGLDNELFRTYAFYAVIVAIKLIIMSPLTGFTRIATKTFANPEDAAAFRGKARTDARVERIRRAHLNDLENIPAFWVLSYLYILTNPSYSVGVMCFRIFVGARIIHTVAYLTEIFPVRALCFAVGFLVNMYMGIQVLFALL